MLTHNNDVLREEPDTKVCKTERITSELSRCFRNNKACKYGLAAGKTSTYCLHPDNREFYLAHSR